ncbi:5730_t:CDS:2 [Paraglomus brasilianum]|uniref:5730_t:CDS:1 n=1 Tax=Paraglomus brasilianum TaxID=144538 RepID=A0A9N9FGT6_9GLOM|nr:5730_t:CDS:2 [Paraglomus brasilianum]
MDVASMCSALPPTLSPPPYDHSSHTDSRGTLPPTKLLSLPPQDSHHTKINEDRPRLITTPFNIPFSGQENRQSTTLVPHHRVDFVSSHPLSPPACATKKLDIRLPSISINSASHSHQPKHPHYIPSPSPPPAAIPYNANQQSSRASDSHSTNFVPLNMSPQTHSGWNSPPSSSTLSLQAHSRQQLQTPPLPTKPSVASAYPCIEPKAPVYPSSSILSSNCSYNHHSSSNWTHEKTILELDKIREQVVAFNQTAVHYIGEIKTQFHSQLYSNPWTNGQSGGTTRLPLQPENAVDELLVRAHDIVQVLKALKTEMKRTSSEREDNAKNGFCKQEADSNPSGRKYRKRTKRAAPPGRCHSCHISETPEWRRGPDEAQYRELDGFPTASQHAEVDGQARTKCQIDNNKSRKETTVDDLDKKTHK